MEVRAPKGRYRVIGLDPVDTLTWPSGPLWKDCETFDKALDLAASNDELYLRIYIYNDNGEILHEAGCYREQLKKIHEIGRASCREEWRCGWSGCGEEE